MKRFHVHVGVHDLDQSVQFYSTLFATPPTVKKHDYAKWMLDDPRVNFAISKSSKDAGVSHLGIQAETKDELSDVFARLSTADRPIYDEGATTCCYAKSTKQWISDPAGISWETFLTHGDSTTYSNDDAVSPKQESAAPKSACGTGCGCQPAQAA
jgi:catechol-2,3-dioxygenase